MSEASAGQRGRRAVAVVCGWCWLPRRSRLAVEGRAERVGFESTGGGEEVWSLDDGFPRIRATPTLQPKPTHHNRPQRLQQTTDSRFS